MNKILRITGVLFLIFSLSGCLKDGVNECPGTDIRINFYVEKFANRSSNPLDDTEEKFCDRIGHFRYYLYQNNTLYAQGMVEEFDTSTGNYYYLDYSQLEYGDYQIIVVGNCTKKALSGDTSDPANLVLTYPGCTETEDFFSAEFKFTVNSPEAKKYDVGLLRTQGVIRYTFINMPSEISELDIIMENVSSEKWITGDYKNACQAFQNYNLTTLTGRTAEDGYIMGSFPTLSGEKSSFYLNLYREGETEPFRSELISNDLTVTRNQLLDIAVTFNDGNISYEILLDSSWGGTSPGGETGID